MTGTHTLLDYRYIPDIADTEDYPWREYKPGGEGKNSQKT